MAGHRAQRPSTGPAAAALALLILAGCHKAAPADPAAETPTWVGRENIAVAEQRTLEVGPAISGTLAAEREATVRAEIGGAVLDVSAEPGQPVSRGAVLARLDDSAIRDAFESARSAVRTAELSVEIAKREAARARALVDAGAIAERDVETAEWNETNAEGQLADARSRLATAEKQLGKTVIRAPFTGVVSERPANVGDIVQSGNPLFTIVDPASLKLEGTVPVENIAALKLGTPVSFTVAGAGTGSITGRVIRINPTVDPATRQVRVTVAVPNTGRALIAGLFAEGRVASTTRTSVIVPSEAVDRRGIRPYVVRIKDGRVARVEVELGLIDQATDAMEVLKGLSPGDTLLLGGARGLAPDTRVRVGSPSELNAPGAPGARE